MVSTAHTLAVQYGVAEKTIRRDGIFAQIIDKLVADYGDPEAKRKLLGADVKLSHGLARHLLKMPPEERKAAVKQLIEMGELPRAKKEDRSPAPKPKDVAQAIYTRIKAKGEDHAKAVLRQLAGLLGMEVSEKS